MPLYSARMCPGGAGTPVDGLRAAGQVLEAASVGHAGGRSGTLVGLVRPAVEVRLGEGIEDAVFACGADVMDGSRQGGEAHSSRPAGSARTRMFIPCFLCLPEQNGRSAAIRSHGHRCAVEQNERFPRPCPDGLFERGCQGSKEIYGFGDVPVGRGRSDAEPGRELGIGMPVAQVGEGEQGLSAGAEPAPPAPDHAAALAYAGGQEAKARAGQVKSRRVDKHVKLLVGTGDLLREPVYQGLHSSVTPTAPPARQAGKTSVSPPAAARMAPPGQSSASTPVLQARPDARPPMASHGRPHSEETRTTPAIHHC